MMCQSTGLPPISTIGFGRTEVSSVKREPTPPARITAFTAGRFPQRPVHMPVPLFDTRTPLEPLADELRAAIDRVVEGGRFILGPEVAAFEQEFASYLGVSNAIGV